MGDEWQLQAAGGEFVPDNVQAEDLARRDLKGFETTIDLFDDDFFQDSLKTHRESKVLFDLNLILVFLPIFVGLWSVTGSYVILREVLVDQTLGRGNSIKRSFASLSVANLFFTLGSMMSTFVSPAHLTYIWGNVGNTATCEMQGFLLLVGYLVPPLTYLILAYFYVLIIRFGLPDQALRRIEPLVHSITWALSLIVAIYALIHGMYNNDRSTCWIAEYPLDCNYTHRYRCTRGQGASYFAHILTFLPFWPCLVLCGFILVILNYTVRQIEDRERRIPSKLKLDNQIDSRISWSVTIQFALHFVVFAFSYGFVMLATMMDELTGSRQDAQHYFAFSICMPLQGLLNCFVFMRRRRMQTPEGERFRSLLYGEDAIVDDHDYGHVVDTDDEAESTKEPSVGVREKDILNDPSNWFCCFDASRLENWSY